MQRREFSLFKTANSLFFYCVSIIIIVIVIVIVLLLLLLLSLLFSFYFFTSIYTSPKGLLNKKKGSCDNQFQEQRDKVAPELLFICGAVASPPPPPRCLHAAMRKSFVLPSQMLF